MTYSFCEALLCQHSNYPDEAYQIVTPETTFLTPLKTQLDSLMRSVNALLTVFHCRIIYRNCRLFRPTDNRRNASIHMVFIYPKNIEILLKLFQIGADFS